MSGLMAFATGFLNGSVEVQREKAAAEIADNEAKALQLEQGRSAITDLIKRLWIGLQMQTPLRCRRLCIER